MVKNNDILETSRLITNDYRNVFGDYLVSVILYGSALTNEYVPKKSDLNFLIVLSEEGIEQLHLAHEPVAKWQKKKVNTPLFLTKAYIESSLDTFPIEFLNIKRNYKLIFGEDVLTGLSFKKDFVRLQCERELKGKLLLLRERYVETKGQGKALENLFSNTVPAFIFVFKGILYLLDKQIPETKHETVRVIAKEFKLDEDLFLSLLKIREGLLKPSAAEKDILFQKYLREIRKVVMLIDRWERPGLL